MKKTIQMEELVCPMCAQKIETALKKAPGVTAAAVLWSLTRTRQTWENWRQSSKAWAMW